MAIEPTSTEAQPANRGSLFRPYTLLAVVLLIVLAFPGFRRDQDWISVYLPAAERLADGGDIYLEGAGFVYPPIDALMALPFVHMPHLVAKGVWYVLNMICLGVLIWGAWKLSGGGRLEGSPPVSWREHAVFWLGIGVGISSCLDVVTNEQTDLIVAALAILGCLALSGERNIRAGIWFGLAAAVKCTPLLFAPYLAWKRRWVAAGLVVGVAILVNLVPDLTHPPRSGSRLGDWTSRLIMPMAKPSHEFGTWSCGIGGNQSAPGLWQRYLLYDASWNGEDLDVTLRANRADPITLKAASWGTMLLLLGVALACFWKSSRSGDAQRGLAGTPAPSAIAVECGMILILMVLLSPHTSKPHFCTLLLPGFCVARAGLIGRSRGLLALVTLAAVVIVASNKDLIGNHFFAWGKWYGALPWCSLLLFVGSCWTLLRKRAAAVAEPERRVVEATEVRRAA